MIYYFLRVVIRPVFITIVLVIQARDLLFTNNDNKYY